MDLNLEYWQNNGKSFLSRLRIWFNLLDPSSLLASDAEIEKARCLLRSEEKQQKNEKIHNAWTLSVSSVHADSGAVISPVFRPQAFLPISVPLVVASFLPHKGVRPALFWHFILQSYCAGFNHASRNTTATQGNKTSAKQPLLIVGAVSYSTVVGALPQIVIQRMRVSSTVAQAFCRSVLPIPLSAILAAFSVMVVRSEESENGIQIFDSNGNSVGVSKKAGSKAVKETAISRATLFGTTATVPTLLLYFLRRAKFVQRNLMIAAPVRHISTAIVLGLMIPVSFSLFPQLGKIEKQQVEKELQALTDDQQLFYHRGL
ncbi:sideroflexin-4 [Colossoma macropomum]|uniref:sideroflexin-4 n=1 Tax=Colossoma macropomum TaxID=42526 RepID=UPI001864C5A3|nr:sideroflexin-4 [Colossoma macropomum]XP_036430443.1 sideroflexin-4 [Colossoma macropomum]